MKKIIAKTGQIRFKAKSVKEFKVKIKSFPKFCNVAKNLRAIKDLKNKPNNFSLANRIDQVVEFNNGNIRQDGEIRQDEPQVIENEDIIRIGKKHFSINSLSDLDIQLIKCVLDNKNILACLPDNDKKFVYQVSAYFLEGTCIVISQYLSVLNFQYKRLSDLNIPCCLVNSESVEINSNFKFIFIDLNVLKSERVQNNILSFNARIKVSLIVLQESQCIAKYSVGFREKYSIISNFTVLLSSAKFLCTSIPLVETEKKVLKAILVKEFLIPNFPLFLPELIFKVEKYENYGTIAKLIDENYSGKRGIIIYPTVNGIKNLCDALNEKVLNCGFISSKISDEQKKANVQAWNNGNLNILVVASMFNLDFYIENVEFAMHINRPNSIQECVSEIAYIRNNSKVFEYLVLNRETDFTIPSYFKDNNIPTVLSLELEEYYRCIEFLENFASCRKVNIYKYFGYEIEPCNKWCDFCVKLNRGGFYVIERDFSSKAREILRNLADNTGYELSKIMRIIQEKKIIDTGYAQSLVTQMLLKRILYKKNSIHENRASLIYKNVEFSGSFFDLSDDIDDSNEDLINIIEDKFVIKLNILEKKEYINLDCFEATELSTQLIERGFNQPTK